MIFRPYQDSALEQIGEYAVDHHDGRLLVVVPPRAGKTVIAAAVMHAFAFVCQEPGLWFARGRELIEHARRHLIEAGIPADAIGMIMSGGDSPDPTRLIQVASFDTITRRNKPVASLVISDEAHHDASDGRRALRNFYSDALRVGFTGTPVRSDNRGLHDDYDDILIISSPSELIAGGYLSAPRIFSVAPERMPDLRDVHQLANDYDLGELERVTDLPVLNQAIVREWKRLAENRRTVVFPTTVKHSRNIVAEFIAAGVPAAHLDGDTPTKLRAEIIDFLRAGELLVVSSCGVLSQGVDLPEVKCAVNARATMSLALHMQQSFRPLTPWNDVQPIILDHAGNVLRPGLGLPHADRPWSLRRLETGRKGRGRVNLGQRHDGVSEPGAAKRCVACGAVSPATALACENCARSFDVAERVEVEDPGELVEVKVSYTDDEKAADWARIQEFATRAKSAKGWAERVYRARFGESVNKASA